MMTDGKFDTSEKWLLLASILVIGWLVYLLAPVLTPFAIAAVLAYLGDPATDWLESKGLSRTLAVVVVFAVFTTGLLIALLILVPLVQKQLRELIEAAPAIIQWLQGKLDLIIIQLGGDEADVLRGGDWIAIAREHAEQVGGLATTIVTRISRSGLAIIGVLLNLFLVPVVAFYLLRDWDGLIEKVRTLLPRRLVPTVSRLARESDEVLGAFLRGQLLVMLVLGTIYSIGLWIIGIKFALLIGMVAGLISFVPYLGTIVGVGAGLIAAFFQYQDLAHPAMVAAVFIVGQMAEGMLLTPLLVGDKIGMHPVAVIFAVLAGGQLFGFLGVLLALPVAAVVMVLLRYGHERYRSSRLYTTGEPPPQPD